MIASLRGCWMVGHSQFIGSQIGNAYVPLAHLSGLSALFLLSI